MNTFNSPAGQRQALRPKEFLQRYPIGRTKLWQEIKAGNIPARKIGVAPEPGKPDKRPVLIDAAGAERWYQSQDDAGRAA
jgi:hypothetical protein